MPDLYKFSIIYVTLKNNEIVSKNRGLEEKNMIFNIMKARLIIMIIIACILFSIIYNTVGKIGKLETFRIP